MNRRVLLGITMMFSLGILATGCKMGNVSMDSEASSSHKETASEVAKRKVSESKERKSEASEVKKEERQQLGKKYQYGLPKGPSWLYFYTQGKKTAVHLMPDKNVIAKAYEAGTFYYGGELPLVGTITTPKEQVQDSSSEATLNDSANYKQTLASDDAGLTATFCNLKNADPKAISARAFKDLRQFYTAVDNSDPTQLPNNSADLKNQWSTTGRLASDDTLETKYEIQKQYFDPGSLITDPQSNDAATSTHVVVDHKTIDADTFQQNTTLYIQSVAQVKETEVSKTLNGGMPNDQYGKSQTMTVKYNLLYELTPENTWQLNEISEEKSSAYAVDTSDGKWIIEKTPTK